MTSILYLVASLLVIPFLTYWAIAFYVQVRMALGDGFSLFGGLMKFSPIDMPKNVTPEDVMDHVKDYLDDAK